MSTLDKVFISIAISGLVSVGIVYLKAKLSVRKTKKEAAAKEAELKAKVQPKRAPNKAKKKAAKKK